MPLNQLQQHAAKTPTIGCQYSFGGSAHRSETIRYIVVGARCPDVIGPDQINQFLGIHSRIAITRSLQPTWHSTGVLAFPKKWFRFRCPSPAVLCHAPELRVTRSTLDQSRCERMNCGSRCRDGGNLVHPEALAPTPRSCRRIRSTTQRHRLAMLVMGIENVNPTCYPSDYSSRLAMESFLPFPNPFTMVRRRVNSGVICRSRFPLTRPSPSPILRQSMCRHHYPCR